MGERHRRHTERRSDRQHALERRKSAIDIVQLLSNGIRLWRGRLHDRTARQQDSQDGETRRYL